jgi:alkyl sulfatase BDS1-like metallo-beta-lactamase superfamily hydrolase
MRGKALKNIISATLLLSNAFLEGEASKFTNEINREILKKLPFENTEDFDEASRGFIAPLPNKGIIKNEKGEIIWDLTTYDFMNKTYNDTANSSTVNPSLWRQVALLQRAGLFKVTDGIYQIRGADLSNITIVEGKTGIIVIDTLLSKETAKAAMELYFQNRSKKPVIAVIYTHSHGDHFGGVKGIISQQDVDSGKVKVIAPEGFTEAALDENVMAGNVMGRRAMYMYGALIKPGLTGQMSSGLGLSASRGEMTLILPTDFVTKTGQEMVIDGIKFVFLMAPGSEAPSEMLFYIPEFKALGAAEDATHTMHNLYTLRGAKVRDSKAWAKYLNEAIDMFGEQAEVVFAQHHWPKWGNERVIDFLEKQRDMYKYIHDQTLHLANQGYNMVQIGEMIQMPDSLAKEWYNRGYYGSLNQNAKSVYNYYLGWFSGNPSTLHPLPDAEASKKLVEYMGGSEAIMRKAQKDYEDGNYRWVAQVLNYIVFAEPNNKKAKDMLANTLEQLGFQSENGTWRNFYLTGAKELREGVKKQQILKPTSQDMVSMMPIDNFFDYLAIKLNGPKAAENPMMLNFNLPDKNQKYVLQIKNGVLNYFPNKNSDKADLTIAINRTDFNSLLLGMSSLDSLIRLNKASIKGNTEFLPKFLGLFDDFNPWFYLIEPVTNP